MGPIAELMADGTLCAQCGVLIDDEREGYAGACGHPRYCRRCGGKPESNGLRGEQGIQRRGKRPR
jgi:hypothetical protein